MQGEADLCWKQIRIGSLEVQGNTNRERRNRSAATFDSPAEGAVLVTDRSDNKQGRINSRKRLRSVE
jgi:hypothetical protein